MAIKEYVCNECGYTEEFIFSFSMSKPDIPKICPKCNKGKLEYKFSGKGITFDVVGGFSKKPS